MNSLIKNKYSLFYSGIILCVVMLPPLVFAKEEYKRIVSLAPSATESIYSLGLEKKLIAVTSFCDYPDEAKEKEIIGSLINPNIEKIYSLSPDLILAVNGINRPQAIEKLRSLRLNVVAFDECNSFDDIITNFISLGRLKGSGEKAKEIAEKVEAEVRSMEGKLKGALAVKVFWEIEAKPLVSIGANSFANEFIKHSGGINIFADNPVKYPRISREEVLNRDPDVIILVTMGGVTEKEKLYWQKFRDLKAAINNRIYVISGSKVCRPTPLSFLVGVREVSGLLHPEIFKEEK